jgi:DNA polymerase III epsilon subunit-like protein
MLNRVAGRDRIAYIDTETTGFDFNGKDRIWEIAVVIWERDADAPVKRSWRIRLDFLLPAVVADLTGVTRTSVMREGGNAADVLAEFASAIDGCVLIGHNVESFDAPFLAAEYHRAGLPVPAELDADNLIDTLLIARDVLAERRNAIEDVAPLRADGRKATAFSLDALRIYFNIDTENAHRALADADSTNAVHTAIVDILNGVA